MPKFPIHAAAAIVSVGLLLQLAKLAAPRVEAPQARMIAEVADFGPATTPVTPAVPHVDAEAAVILHAVTGAAALPVALLEDQAGALDHFYQALWRTEKGEPGAVTRIVHYGDSPTTADLITGDIRSQLQHRFGDAGHGFILIAKPWAWYQHTGAEVSGSQWQMAPASYFKALDGVFGLGGVSFGGSAGAHSQVKFRDAHHTRFELWFEQQHDGGVVAVEADGRPAARIATSGEEGPGFSSFTVGQGARTLDLQVEQGRVRLFGLVAETGKDGVVYDSLGLNGASITVLSRMFNQAHWTAELRHRNPDLVVINYGTNEADFASFIEHQYEKELREAIRRLRAALPEASILVMSPMDRGTHGASGIETMATIPRIVALQKRVARETGCGFFDTFHAMGGDGTMARWNEGQPRLVSADLIHPYPAGGKLIGTVVVRELTAGLNRFKLRAMQDPPRRESAETPPKRPEPHGPQAPQNAPVRQAMPDPQATPAAHTAPVAQKPATQTTPASQTTPVAQKPAAPTAPAPQTTPVAQKLAAPTAPASQKAPVAQKPATQTTPARQTTPVGLAAPAPQATPPSQPPAGSGLR